MTLTLVNKNIINALFEIMKKKKFEDISVAELVEKAEVGRASFYRNFGTKEAVLRSYFEIFFQPISYKDAVGLEGFREGLIKTYREVLKDKMRFVILQNQGLFSYFDDAIYEKSVFEMMLKNSYSSVYHASGLSGASAFLIRTWIKNGFDKSPEELAEEYLNLFSLIVKEMN
ncbi:MAG: TetR/AcrR family transcriptional regulator [Clostridia bacterium]|nr:TetR/AcrR family transcriptional regulator [Clostridia bacterium]